MLDLYRKIFRRSDYHSPRDYEITVDNFIHKIGRENILAFTPMFISGESSVEIWYWE